MYIKYQCSIQRNVIQCTHPQMEHMVDQWTAASVASLLIYHHTYPYNPSTLSKNDLTTPWKLEKHVTIAKQIQQVVMGTRQWGSSWSWAADLFRDDILTQQLRLGTANKNHTIPTSFVKFNLWTAAELKAETNSKRPLKLFNRFITCITSIARHVAACLSLRLSICNSIVNNSERPS